MDTVFIVTYEFWDDFLILEVYKTREGAEKYLESQMIKDMVRNGYDRDSFYIIEKVLWEDD